MPMMELRLRYWPYFFRGKFSAKGAARLSLEAGTPKDGYLVGLLTYASRKLNAFPVSQWQTCSASKRLQLRGSGGFSPRFPVTRRGELYLRDIGEVKQRFFGEKGIYRDLPR
jgi:hypothetical protein